MEVKVSLNRRTIFDALVIVQLVLLIVYGGMLISISKKVNGGGGGSNRPAVANQAAIPRQPSPALAAGTVKPLSQDDWVRGDGNAPISVIEYSDLECPFCKRFHPTVQQLLNEYDGKVKWVYRHYPLSFHANAQKEAEATECAGELGGSDIFWQYVDAIFERTTANGTGFALADLPKLAQELGLNQSKFEECLNSDKYAAKVQQQLSEGTAAGVSGTPSTFVVIDKTGASQQVEGAVPYQQLKQAVDAALNQL